MLKLAPDHERLKDELRALAISLAEAHRVAFVRLRTSLLQAGAGAVASFGRLEAPLSEMEQEAARIVPHRVVPGILTLENLTAEQQNECMKKFPHARSWCILPLFWIDGSRSLLEVTRCARLESPDVGPDLLDFFHFLNRVGYLRFEAANGQR